MKTFTYPIVLFISLLFVGFASHAQSPMGDDLRVEIRPEAGSWTPVRPAPFEEPLIQSRRGGVDPVLSAFLQHVLNEERKRKGTKGVSAAIALPDGSVWKGASGQSSNNRIVNTDMVFGIGSTTKTFVAAAILQLREEGKLQLEDPLSKYFAPMPHIDSTINLRQMLNHTSGIFNYTNHPNLGDSINANYTRIWTPQEVLDAFMDVPAFPKGTNWGYSNTNYLLLGEIIKMVSGNSFEAEIRSRFLTPLSLDRTYFWPWEPLQGDKVNLWMDLSGNGVLRDVTTLGLSLKSFWTIAGTAGAYYSTADDMSRWALALYGGQVLEDTSLQEMLDFVSIPGGGSYGLGVFKNYYAGRECWGHGGDISFAGQVYFSTVDSVGITVQTNDGLTYSFGLDSYVDSLLGAYIKYTSTISSVDPDFHTFPVNIGPNPFSSELNFSYKLESSGPVKIELLNLMGQRVRTLLNERQLPGQHEVNWDGRAENELSLSPGTYLYRIQTEEGRATGKLIKW